MQTFQKRQVAKKANIAEINNGKFVKVAGEFEPSYVLTPAQRTISRLNIIGVVVDEADETEKSAVIDDGTGRISLRVFDNIEMLKNLKLGDAVMVIGKVRSFGNQNYIMPEIIKNIQDKRWIELRKLELQLLGNEAAEKSETQKKEEPSMPIQEDYIEETVNFANEHIKPETEKKSSSEILIGLIKKKDKGNGADFEEIIAESRLRDAEKLLNTMLEAGEVFEIRPGRIKLL